MDDNRAESEWDQYADGWDDDPAARSYAAAAFTSLRELLDESTVSLAGAAVLDFGCGTGLLTERLIGAGASVLAVDTSHAMLNVLGSKPQLADSSAVETSTTLPSSGERFDLVVCSSVCSFLDDYPASVVALLGLLKPAGIFVQWDWERAPGDDHGLTRDEIVGALDAAGLGNVEVRIGFEVDFEGEPMAPLMGHGAKLSS